MGPNEYIFIHLTDENHLVLFRCINTLPNAGQYYVHCDGANLLYSNFSSNIRSGNNSRMK